MRCLDQGIFSQQQKIKTELEPGMEEHGCCLGHDLVPVTVSQHHQCEALMYATY